MTNLTKSPNIRTPDPLASNDVISKLLLLLILSVCASFEVFAQAPSYVFVRNAPASTRSNPVIQVKWFSEDILNPEGFNLYRRELGESNWTRLNSVPLTKGVMPAAIKAADEELDFLVDVVNQAPEDLKEEFLFMNLLLKSFESNQLANFLGIFYNDTGVRYGTSYQYRVGVIRGADETYLTPSRSIESADYGPLAPIEGIEVFQEKKTIVLNWEQNEQSFYAVNIYAVAGTGDTLFLNKEPVILSMVPDSTGNYDYPDPMFKASGFEELETYSFYLKGVDYFGELTEPSKSVSIQFDDTTPPPLPSNVRGRADSLRVRLIWNQEMVPDFKGFNIFRSTKSTGPFEKVNSNILAAETREFREKLEIPGPYYYAVEAVDHSNNQIRSVPAFVEAQDVFPPAKPQGLTIKADTGKMVLTWKMNQEKDLLGYYIYRTVDSDNRKNYVLMNGDPIDTNAYIQVLPKVVKNDFFYYVVAVDTSFNRSPDSDFATAVLPDVTPPEQPFIESVDYTEEGIQLTWTGNVETDLAGYHILRSDSTGGRGQQVNVDALPIFSTRYLDRSASPNQEYFYSVVAFDKAGNISSNLNPTQAYWYQNFEVTEELELKIKSKRRNKTNKLEWDPLESNMVKGYIVFRGPSERVVKPLTGVLREKFTFTDKVERDQDYFYQVRAYTQTGQVIASDIIETRIN
ncbi:fibronectin type III domain-containing protein [Marinoscillum sp.]|uniref:fibronectin type III domain-containing protein n=1 Tax=Marinoscillum sp. TaxID=2024838 RepID=UPI003BA85B50